MTDIHQEAVWPRAFAAFVDDYIERHGRSLGYSARDLTVRPAGAGRFTITDRNLWPIAFAPLVSGADIMKAFGRPTETGSVDQSNG